MSTCDKTVHHDNGALNHVCKEPRGHSGLHVCTDCGTAWAIHPAK